MYKKIYKIVKIFKFCGKNHMSADIEPCSIYVSRRKLESPTVYTGWEA